MDWMDMAGKDLQVRTKISDPTTVILCPYCERNDGFTETKISERASGEKRLLINSTLKCSACGNISFITYSPRPGNSETLTKWVLYPKRPAEDAGHESWPVQVAGYFVQATRSLGTKSWDAAAMMARSVLQSVMRDFGAVGGGLHAEILDLASKGLIVNSLAAWAQHVRLVVNDVVHPDPTKPLATEEDARDLVKFTEYFLHYVYTIPWEIKDQQVRVLTNGADAG